MTKQNHLFRRLDALLTAGLMLAMLLTPLAGFGRRCAQVRGEVLRLHILANSDSAADQALKLLVRDAVLRETGDLFSSAATLEEALALAEESLPAIEETARRALEGAGCGDPVKAELTRMYFSTRTYGEDTLPAGEYAALRLTIGEAQGQNWWCVMFPPLCESPALDKQDVEDFSAEAQDVLEVEPTYDVRFAIVDFFVSLFGG